MAKPAKHLTPEQLQNRRDRMRERHQRYLDAYLGYQRIDWRKRFLMSIGPVLAGMEKIADSLAEATPPGPNREALVALLRKALADDRAALMTRIEADAEEVTHVLREQIERYWGRFGGPLNGWRVAHLQDPALRQREQAEFAARMAEYTERADAADEAEQTLRQAAYQQRLAELSGGE